MLVNTLSSYNQLLEGYEQRLRKQERCPEEEGISRMVFKRFKKEVGESYINKLIVKHIDDTEYDIRDLVRVMEFNFQREKRLPLVKRALKAKDKDRYFLKLINNVFILKNDIENGN